eukprot:scpid82447/ scgid17893/ 
MQPQLTPASQGRSLRVCASHDGSMPWPSVASTGTAPVFKPSSSGTDRYTSSSLQRFPSDTSLAAGVTAVQAVATSTTQSLTSMDPRVNLMSPPDEESRILYQAP